MPAATKKTTARRPRKATPAKPDDAVEAALKVYKTRVAEKVKHYQENGDLCAEEAREIRKDLELEEFLPQKVKIKVEYTADVNAVWTGQFTPNENAIASALADAIQKFLEAGVEIEGTSYRFGNVEKFKGKLTFKDVEQEDYEYEDKDEY